MNSLKHAMFAGSILTITLLILSLSNAIYAQADKTVVVVNTAANPVPVRSVDVPAPIQPYQAVIDGSSLPTVPAGKLLVIEHVSGHYRVPSASGSAGPCRILQLSLLLGSGGDIDVVPVFMGTGTGINSDVNFFTFSQAVRSYVTAGSEFGAANYVGSQYCSGFPTVSHVVVSGHLENAN
jgi:hypothetical protein